MINRYIPQCEESALPYLKAEARWARWLSNRSPSQVLALGISPQRTSCFVMDESQMAVGWKVNFSDVTEEEELDQTVFLADVPCEQSIGGLIFQV